MEFGVSFVHNYQDKLCTAPGPGVASVRSWSGVSKPGSPSCVQLYYIVVLCLSGVCVRFVYLQSCLHSTSRLHIFLTQLHKTDPHMKNEQVWLVLYCLMRVSYICHETKVCVPHLIYQTEKKLGSNECSTQMQTYLPIQLYTFLSWFQWTLYDN